MVDAVSKARPTSFSEQFSALLSLQGARQRRATGANLCLILCPVTFVLLLLGMDIAFQSVLMTTVPEDLTPSASPVSYFEATDIPYLPNYTPDADADAALLALDHTPVPMSLFYTGTNADDLMAAFGSYQETLPSAGTFWVQPFPFADASAMDDQWMAQWFSGYDLTASPPVASSYPAMGGATVDLAADFATLDLSLFGNETNPSTVSFGSVPSMFIPTVYDLLASAWAYAFRDHLGATGTPFYITRSLADYPHYETQTGIDLLKESQVEMLGFALHVSLPFVTALLVRDKEMGIRRFLAMSGIRSAAYYLASGIAHVCIAVVNCLMLMASGYLFDLPFFTDNSPLPYLLLCVPWALCVVAQGWFVASCCPTSRVATVVAWLAVVMLNETSTVLNLLVPVAESGFEPKLLVPSMAVINALIEIGSTYDDEAFTLANATSLYWSCLVHLVAGCAIFVALTVAVEKYADHVLGAVRTFFALIKGEKQHHRQPAAASGPSELPVLSPGSTVAADLADSPAQAAADDVIAVPASSLHHPNPGSDVAAEARAALEAVEAPILHPQTVIALTGLHKTYRSVGTAPVEAVCGVSFQSEEGEVVAILGKNGSGKSTTVTMSLGALAPTSGDGRILGASIRDAAAMRRVAAYVGVVPQDTAYWPELSAEQHCRFFASVRGVPAAAIDAEVARVLSSVHLTSFAAAAAGTFSGGMRRRLACAMALVASPRLIVLDEAATGLDPASRRQLWDAILAAKRAGTTFLLVTHSMEECEALASKVIIMRQGRVAATGTLEELRERFGNGIQLSVERRVDVAQPVLDAFVASICPTAERRTCVLTKSVYALVGIGEPHRETLEEVLRNLAATARDAGIVDWAVNHSSLSSVFLATA
jgi:ABC-type multidrug transport system ATPase subunit